MKVYELIEILMDCTAGSEIYIKSGDLKIEVLTTNGPTSDGDDLHIHLEFDVELSEQ